jgi:hypothetical protein
MAVMGSRGVAFLRIAISGLFLLAAAQLATAQAQSAELDDLYRRGMELYQAGKYADTIPIAEQYIKVAATSFGEDDPIYATGLETTIRQSSASSDIGTVLAISADTPSSYPCAPSWRTPTGLERMEGNRIPPGVAKSAMATARLG